MAATFSHEGDAGLVAVVGGRPAGACSANIAAVSTGSSQQHVITLDPSHHGRPLQALIGHALWRG